MKKPSSRKTKNTKENDLHGLFAELKHEYLDSFDEKIKDIEEFWQKGDRTNLQNEYHKIKGTGTTYGVQEVTEVADLMEDLCEKNSKHLGLCVMLSIEAFRKICFYHSKHLEMDLSKEHFYKILNHFAA